MTAGRSKYNVDVNAARSDWPARPNPLAGRPVEFGGQIRFRPFRRDTCASPRCLLSPALVPLLPPANCIHRKIVLDVYIVQTIIYTSHHVSSIEIRAERGRFKSNAALEDIAYIHARSVVGGGEQDGAFAVPLLLDFELNF